MPARPERPAQSNIPPTGQERQRVLQAVREHAANGCKVVPPVPLYELRVEAAALSARHGIDPAFVEFTALLLNNELWRESLATIPYERRLLLLPKCLRVEEHCPAPFDELGLLCKKCGLCSIQDLQEEAERMGYAVLVAEGSPIVMAILQTGQIDAIVGVSCLHVLEKVYGYMEAAAVPGIALPLFQDDCIDTNVDLDWVWDAVHLTSDDNTRRLDLGGLRDQVRTFFEPAALDQLLGPVETATERMGREWLASGGKRWRPFLTVAMAQSLCEAPGGEISDDLKRVAVAVECFHKASLIHDDVEDGDAERDGRPTLQAEHGVAVAINAGDYLLGEGYRLLALSSAPPERLAEMLRLAAEGHRALSVGQGEELLWHRDPQPMKAVQVVDIFRRKTAPAFEIALRIGAAYAGADAALHAVLHDYSESLGIAYQIRDDLDDLVASRAAGEAPERRPTLPWSMAWEKAKPSVKPDVATAWIHTPEAQNGQVKAAWALLDDLSVESRCRELMTAYQEEAIKSLRRLEDATVKGLLRRVVGKIFDQLRIEGWCREHEARNAASS
jgi:geranylgeranyl pyrophosphate synthase